MATQPAQRRVLVVNFDSKWEFSLLCRRSALDLYRVREPLDGAPPRPENVDFWDVREIPLEKAEAAREVDDVWRYWPRHIGGGVRGVLAELDEKLSAEFSTDSPQQMERLTVLVVAAVEDIVSDADGNPDANVCEFLMGLREDFATARRPRDSVKVVLVINDRKLAGAPPDLACLTGSGKGAPPLPDAVLLLAQSGQSYGDQPGAFLFLCMRLAVDLFRSEQFALSFFLHASSDAALDFHVDASQLPAAHTGRYAAVVVESLRAKYAEAQKQPPRRPGEIDPFVRDVNVAIFGEHYETERRRPARERDGGSYAIVGKVIRNFSVRLEVKSASFTQLHDELKPERPPWLGRDYPIDAPILLERAVVHFLKDLQAALQTELTGQKSVFASHERASVDERMAAVGKLQRLNLDGFGTGERAGNNFEESKSLVQSEIAAIEDEITAFWRNFGADGDSVPSKGVTDTGIDQVRTHCPLLQTAWPQTQELIRQYDDARRIFNDLATCPSAVLWIALCVSVFAMLPLLWFGLWILHPDSKAIPVVSLAIWFGLFCVTVAAPVFRLKRQRDVAEAALRDLAEAAGKAVEEMEKQLRRVVEYVGIVQRHHFLHRLIDRLNELAGEASRVGRYLKTVEDSLGQGPAARQVDRGEVERVVSALQGAGECRRWLDVALTSIALMPPKEIQATLPDSKSPILASTCLLENPVKVNVADTVAGRGHHGP